MATLVIALAPMIGTTEVDVPLTPTLAPMIGAAEAVDHPLLLPPLTIGTDVGDLLLPPLLRLLQALTIGAGGTEAGAELHAGVLIST